MSRVNLTVGVDKGEALDKLLKLAEVSKFVIPITVFGWDLVYRVDGVRERDDRRIYVLKETMPQ